MQIILDFYLYKNKLVVSQLLINTDMHHQKCTESKPRLSEHFIKKNNIQIPSNLMNHILITQVVWCVEACIHIMCIDTIPN